MKNLVIASILAMPFLMTSCTSTGGLDVGRLKALTSSVLFGGETIDIHDPRVKNEFIKQII